MEDWVTVQRKKPSRPASNAPTITSSGPTKSSSAEVKAPAAVASKQKENQQHRAQKEARKKSARPPCSNRKELIALINNLMLSSPGSSLTVAGIGDRLHAVTRHSWNKKFKSKFGSLGAFLESTDEFVVQGDLVYTKADFQRLEPNELFPNEIEESEQGASTLRRRAQKGDAKESAGETNVASSQERTASTKCKSAFYAILLLLFTTALTLIYTGVISIDDLNRQISQGFRDWQAQQQQQQQRQ